MRVVINLAIKFLFLSTGVLAAFALGGDQIEETHFSADAAALYDRVSQISAPAGADVLVLDRQETLTFDAEGGAVRSQYILYKVLTQKGAAGWADLSLEWEPWRQERPRVRARVIAPDRTVHSLDEGTITDAPAKETQDDIFSNRRVVRAPLPAVAPGSLVEEEHTSNERAPFLGAGAVERYYFGGSVPVRHTRLLLDAPAVLPVHYELRLLPDLQPQRTEADGRIRITFDYGPIDPVEDVDTELPSDIPVYPSITFSTGHSWQQIAEEYGRIVDQQIATADLKSLVAKLVAGRNSRDDKAAAVLQYVSREVRYTGVEFGDATVVPRTPHETLSRKYGDCKDKSTLLVGMLRTAGVPAYVVLLNAGSREDVAPDLPGMGMFDHAIVYVPGPPDAWIDATDEYARLGEMPIADQDRLALIARPVSNGLVRTPGTASEDNALIEKREIYLAESGPARIVETSRPHGSDEASYRRAYADKDNKRAREGLTDYVKGQYLAEKLDRIDRSDPNDLSKQFELVLESDRARRGATDLKIAVAAIRLDGLFDRLPPSLRQREPEGHADGATVDGQEARKKRTADYQLAYPFVTEWQYKITPPPGFQPKPLPQNATLSLGPAVLTQEFLVAKDNSVSADIRFEIGKRRLTVGEGTEMRDQIVQLREGQPILIYFEPIAETLLTQGRVREALQSYRDLIALHPKEAVHHLQVAQTLLDAGLGEAARSEAQAAVRIEPASALAQKTLAEILEYDLVGRKFRTGSDYAGAEAAFRAAIKLDPDDKATVANLAILLEYNSWGLRYGPGARLKDAIAEYRTLSAEKLADLGVPNNLAFALFYAGEFAEAQANAQTLNPQPIALIVACEAALKGSQVALAEAAKRTSGEPQFKEVVKTAGEMLANLRKYPLAADLKEAGASGDNASETAAYASLYRKTQPHEQLQFADDPVSVALRYELITRKPGLTLDQLRSISSRNGKIVLATPEMFEGFVKSTRSTQNEQVREGSFPDVGLDLALARAQPRLQGDDASGYKVVLWASADYRSAAYVVKEEGHYKLLATSQYTAAIGLEVLDRVAANDLVGARKLLDWLREDQHLPGGDDPLWGSPFPRFWTKGRDADVLTIKLSAASILTLSKQTALQGLATLEASRESVTSDLEKLNVELALLNGYQNLENSTKIVATSVDLAKQYPESRRVFLAQAYALQDLGRLGDADRLAEDRLKRIPGDVDAMRTRIHGAVVRGDYAKAHALSGEIIDKGTAEPEDLNISAWYSLFMGKVEAQDIEDALKAAQLSGRKGYILHTLGCLYAEVGRTKEAREVLLQAMDSLNEDEPSTEYWYAFGRVAEQYGERAVALANYARVTKPEHAASIPFSSYRLAQIRVQALEKQQTKNGSF